MSDVLCDVLNILAHRSTATRQRQVEAKGTYARFMLSAKSHADSADAVVAAADDLGIGTEGIIRDLVNMAFVKALPAQIAENDAAVEEARAAILEAKREVTVARGRMSPTAIARANANLRERVSDAVALEEWGESLRKGLDVFKERGEAFKADIDAAAATEREAEHRKKQFAAENQAARAPADSGATIGAAVSTSGSPNEPAIDETQAPIGESVAPAGTAASHEALPQLNQLGEPIIPDLTPKPSSE